MPRRKASPRYSLHKASGQTKTRIDGKDIYLGPFESPESLDRFEVIRRSWLTDRTVDQFTITVDELSLRYLEHATEYYRSKDGNPTRTADNIRYALRPLVKVHGTTRVQDFGPKALKAVRETMIKAGHSRNYINSMIGKVKQAFRWGVEEEIVPPQVYEALKSLAWLHAGRSKARETQPIRPVDEGTVNDTLPHLPRIVADMVRLQLLCGARPGELCSMRPCDVSRGTTGVWTYRPASLKTEHHGRERRVFIGPEGQAVLAKYLDRDPDAFCFSPAEAEDGRNSTKRANRATPMTPSQAARKTKGRTIRTRYVKDTYNRAIQRGCEIAFGMPIDLRHANRTLARLTKLKKLSKNEQILLKDALNGDAADWRRKHCWSPNQLRYSRATAIRERYGIEAAQTVLGHADPKVTEIYAERDFEMAARIMKEIG